MTDPDKPDAPRKRRQTPVERTGADRVADANQPWSETNPGVSAAHDGAEPDAARGDHTATAEGASEANGGAEAREGTADAEASPDARAHDKAAGDDARRATPSQSRRSAESPAAKVAAAARTIRRSESGGERPADTATPARPGESSSRPKSDSAAPSARQRTRPAEWSSASGGAGEAAPPAQATRDLAAHPAATDAGHGTGPTDTAVSDAGPPDAGPSDAGKTNAGSTDRPSAGALVPVGDGGRPSGNRAARSGPADAADPAPRPAPAAPTPDEGAAVPAARTGGAPARADGGGASAKNLPARPQDLTVKRPRRRARHSVVFSPETPGDPLALAADDPEFTIGEGPDRLTILLALALRAIGFCWLVAAAFLWAEAVGVRGPVGAGWHADVWTFAASLAAALVASTLAVGLWLAARWGVVVWAMALAIILAIALSGAAVPFGALGIALNVGALGGVMLLYGARWRGERNDAAHR